MTEAQQNKARTVIEGCAHWRELTAVQWHAIERMAKELDEELKAEEKKV